MKILISTHYMLPHRGGIEVVAIEQAKRLKSLGHKVTIVSSKLKNDKFFERIENINIVRTNVLNIAEKFGVPYPIPINLKYYKKLIDDSDLIILHGHPYIQNFLIHLINRNRKPVIMIQHNTYINYGFPFSQIERINDSIFGKFNLFKSNRIIAVSKETRKYVLKLINNSKNVDVVYNGVDINRFKPLKEKVRLKKELDIPQDKIIFITTRRLIFKNGLDDLVKCFAKLNIEYDNIYLIIIGKGPDYNLISDLIKKYDLTDSIKLTGFVSDEELPLYYSVSDCFILPSKTGEGFPLSILEALSTGLFVIATDTGGVKEIINKIKDLSFLVPSKDYLALYHAIKKFIDLGSKNSVKNRDIIVKEFSWNQNIKKINAIIEEIIRSESKFCSLVNFL
ncbi:MAG: glycosyltransferase family 4 protein [Candidatus Helarchaeota archaeon]